MKSFFTAAAVALWIGSAYAQYGGGGGSGYSGYSGYNGGSGDDGSGSSGSSSFDFNDIPFGGDYQKAQRAMIAHGVLASLAFVVLFPVGAISIKLFSFRGLVWFHAAFQALAYLVYIAAFGLGIYLAQQTRQLDNAHPIIGIVLLILIFFQPILGVLHHVLFKKHNRRTFWSYGHIWLGRIIVTLGIINGGLGLQLAHNTRTGEIAYGVIAGFMWLVYVVSIFVGESRRKKRRSQTPVHDKQRHLSSGSDESNIRHDGTRYG